jgi:hypothetical protein
VGTQSAVWDLRSEDTIWACLRWPGCGDRPNGMDGVFRDACLFRCGLERREPRKRVHVDPAVARRIFALRGSVPNPLFPSPPSRCLLALFLFPCPPKSVPILKSHRPHNANFRPQESQGAAILPFRFSDPSSTVCGKSRLAAEERQRPAK